MTAPSNFIITIIAFTLGLITGLVYLVTHIEPNIYWVAGAIFTIGVITTLIFSILFYSFSKLRSFETLKQMYRRQLKKAWIFGLLAILVVLAQKFFDMV